MSIVNRTSVLRVIALEISEDGAVSKKQMKIDRDSQLENTLLKADYPDIRSGPKEICSPSRRSTIPLRLTC
jgi:hypothetical protein